MEIVARGAWKCKRLGVGSGGGKRVGEKGSGGCRRVAVPSEWAVAVEAVGKVARRP